MQLIIRQIHKHLLKSKKKLAVAESCTGGFLSYLLTSISGSSQYFILGVVVYSNPAKTSLLGIPAFLIAQKGAVSGEVALHLANAVRKLAKTDFGIGITGIAGPGGGTRDNPKGTVFIAVVSRKQRRCQKFKFCGQRNAIRKAASLRALKLLKSII